MTTIRFRVIFLILTLALSEAVILGVIGYNSVVATAWNETQLKDIMQSHESVGSLKAALIRAEGQARIFYLTGDPYDRIAFDADWTNAESKLNTCSSVACHGGVRQPDQMMLRIRPAMERIRAEHELVFHANRNTADNQESLKVIAANTAEIIEYTNEMASQVKSQVNAAQRKIMESRSSALILIALTTLGVAIGAIILGSLLANTITRPLGNVVAGVRRFAGGQLNERIPENTAPRETRLLAQSFNAMANSLAQYQAGLHEEIRQKDAALSRSEKLVTIGLLASSVGHELNNPLTSLLMNAKLCQEAPNLDADTSDLIRQIVSDAERCRSITADLRRLGRRRATGQSTYDLVEQVNETLRLMTAKAQNRGVRFQRDFPDTVVGCYEREKVLQVLLNLIENAVDVTPPGGAVTIRIRPQPERITIEVSDEGPGIDPENRVRIFEQFFTTKVEGLGLGLAISKHIMEDQGGKIEFESRTAAEAAVIGCAAGTTFRMILPVKEKAKEA